MWLLLLVLVTVLGFLLHRFARAADRIEDDSRGMVDERSRAPYGSKWLAILSFRDQPGRRDD